MSERFEIIVTDAGAMETFMAEPSDAPRGQVILYMDVWGIREELFEIARRVAMNGYRCALPDLYHREGRVRHQFHDAHGRMRSLLSLTPDEQEQVRGPMRRLTDEMAMADTRALLANFDARQGPLAAIGYCMGGRHALLAGGTFPEDIDVAACLHGANLVSGSPRSPHLVGARSKGDVYCGFAELDPFGSPEVVDAIRIACASSGAKLTCNIHQGARHGYALPERDIYDPAATRRDWTEIYRLLESAPGARP